MKRIQRQIKTGLKSAHDHGPASQFSGGIDTVDLGEFEAKGFADRFVLGENIGPAECGQYFEATIKGVSTSRLFTVKRVLRRNLRDNERKALFEEVRVLRGLRHPNVVDVLLFFRSDPTFYFVVFERIRGGELFDRFREKESYNENEVRNTCRVLVETVKYIHDKDVVHRDIRPSNVLLTSSDRDRTLKLTGFGAACSVQGGYATTQARQFEFAAPEILLNKKHGKSVDMWNVGVIVYTLLSATYPFYDKTPKRMYRKTVAIEYDFQDEIWSDVSEAAMNFIRRLLTGSSSRMMATEAISHPWLRSSGRNFINNDLTRHIKRFTLYQAKQKLRVAVNLLLAGRMMFSSLTPDVFSDVYELKEILGQGSSAQVFRAVAITTTEGQPSAYAVKRIPRSGLNRDKEQAVFDEARILRDLDHPNLITIYRFFHNDPIHYYMVLELIEGGELLHRIFHKKCYNEEDARDASRVLLQALKYMHGQNVVHRDIKPENLLLASSTDDTSIRLADFGFACSVMDGPVNDGMLLGTPPYIAPEILEGIPYGTSVDMWSTGVIIYILLSGSFPFMGSTENRLFRRIKRGRFSFDNKRWDAVSRDAKDLVCGLLTLNPEKRLTADEALCHPWLSVSGDFLFSFDLSSALSMIQQFHAKARLRSAVHTVMATRRMSRSS
ncbi:unnamed protein product [Ascophyllum nodosum]